MRVQLGEIKIDMFTNEPQPYNSKAYKYLLPCLKVYGEEFTSRLSNVFKVGVGIGDIIVESLGMKYEKHLFILVSTRIAPNHFISFIEWIRAQEMYVDDYVFDNIQITDLQMVIIKFPEQFYGAFETFKRGEYSKMFDSKTCYELFGNHPEVLKVLVRDHEYKIKFVKKLNRMFNSQVSATEYEGELDLPPKDGIELFNNHLKQHNDTRGDREASSE